MVTKILAASTEGCRDSMVVLAVTQRCTGALGDSTVGLACFMGDLEVFTHLLLLDLAVQRLKNQNRIKKRKILKKISRNPKNVQKTRKLIESIR